MTQRIGRYTVLETLGKGGMGVVYRALDPELEREVAIKVVLSWAQFDDDALARFQREARVVAGLQHRHIVTVYDAGRTDDGLPYFVMEYLQGTDLDEVLGREGSLTAARAVRYMLQVCDGLGYAHGRDIVHRDIKPANLLITPDDEIKIVDFGIAKLVGSRITGSGVSLGTPLYMAPEQLAGRTVDHRADIFALGGVLYAMLAGESPFEAPTLGGICYKIESQAPPPLADRGVEVPAELEAIILKALEKDPEARYASAAAMASHLQKLGDKLQRAASAPTVITTRARGEQRWPASLGGDRRFRRMAALVVVAVLLGALGLWAWPGSPLRSGSGVEAELTEAETPASDPMRRAATGEAAPAGAGDVGEAGQAHPEDAPVQREARDTRGSPGSAPADEHRAEGTGAGQLPAEEVGPAVADDSGERLGGEEPPPLYPAATTERASVNRLAAELFRALEEKDRAALNPLFGGAVPPRERRFLDRLLEGPRLRIRYRIEDVGSAADGLVVARIHQNILFIGPPGKVPPARQSTWLLGFRSDDRGRLTLRSIRVP